MTMLRTIRTSQPTGPVGIDWGNTNPLAVVVSGMHAPRIYARGLAEPFAAATGTGVFASPAAKGIGVGSDASSTNTYRLHSVANQTNTVWEKPTGAVSVLVYLTRTGSSSGQSPLFANADTGTSPAWGLAQQTTTVRFDTQIGGVTKVSPVSNIAVGETAVFIGVYDGTSVSIYKNGVSGGSTAASGALTYVSSADRGPTLGNYYNYTGQVRSFVGRIYMGALWDRALSKAEIKSLSDNPWQIFAPIRTPIFVPIAPVVSIYRPSSDVTTTGWTGTPDNTDKYKNIDEVTASDTDYITSPTITGGESIIFGLTGSLAAGTWDVRYRANFVTATADVKITLLDGSNVSQGTSGWQTVTSSYADYTASVTTTGTATRVKIEVQ